MVCRGIDLCDPIDFSGLGDPDRMAKDLLIENLALQDGELEKYRKEHERLKLLFTITHNIARELVLDRLLRLIMDELKTVLNCDRCTVFILDRDKKELWSWVAHGDQEIRFPSHLGIAGQVATTGEVLNIPDAYADPRFNPNIDKQTGYLTNNILTAPMRNRLGEIIGVFQALNKVGGPFTRDDEELLDAISVIAATQIENAQLYEEQKKTFESFIETLASTIDARDPMTAGHSRRIALYAEEIARILRLDSQQRKILRTSALLHDFGKIGVREAILTKEGTLTHEEFKHIQGHSDLTQAILNKINFSRELRQVPLIAASHHEKVDGSGYPSGLVSEQIPPLAKILAVSDVFDALTSKRHYRDRMDFEEVIRVLDQGTGSQFDGEIINAFKRIKMDRLLLILEDEHRDLLAPQDLEMLSALDTDQLLHPNPNRDSVLKYRAIFDRYYTREYLKGS